MYRLLVVLIATFSQLPTTQAQREKAISCQQRWLQLKNCNLKVGGERYHFTQDRLIFRSENSTWVYDLPGVDQVDKWQTLRIEVVDGHSLIHWYVWSPPKGEAQVQDLRWRVLRVGPDNLSVAVDEIVRHKNNEVRDPMTPHGLKRSKGRVQWHVGHRHGLIHLDRKPAQE